MVEFMGCLVKSEETSREMIAFDWKPFSVTRYFMICISAKRHEVVMAVCS